MGRGGGANGGGGRMNVTMVCTWYSRTSVWSIFNTLHLGDVRNEWGHLCLRLFFFSG